MLQRLLPALLAGLIGFTLPLQAATLSDRKTSPLTARGDLIDKRHDTPRLQWGGQLQLLLGEPPPSAPAVDPLRFMIELGGELTLTSGTQLHALAYYEQQQTDPPEVDELFLQLQPIGPMAVRLGRQYVPFGNYDTAMLQPPLTQQLGETRAEALRLVWHAPQTHLALYGFECAHCRQPIWGGNAGLTTAVLEANFSWISDLAASDAFADLDRRQGPPALGMHLQWTTSRWILHAEWLGAIARFDPGTLSGYQRAAQPSATAVELRLPRLLFAQTTDLLLSVQHSEQTAPLALAHQRWLLALRRPIATRLLLTLEILRQQAATWADGQDERLSHRVTAGLQLRF